MDTLEHLHFAIIALEGDNVSQLATWASSEHIRRAIQQMTGHPYTGPDWVKLDDICAKRLP